jgi:hypothetical protein
MMLKVLLSKIQYIHKVRSCDILEFKIKTDLKVFLLILHLNRVQNFKISHKQLKRN